MAKITKPVILNETGVRIADALETIANIQKGVITNWKDVRGLVQAGEGEKHFPVGSQFIETWTDTANGVSYECPLDVVSHETVTLEDGTEVPGMILQWHYATPFGVSFSNFVPIMYASSEIAAGTYHFTFGSGWGKITANTTYQFTLTKKVPAGGVVVGSNWQDQEPANWKVASYSANNSQAALETAALTTGNGGTDLGTFTTNNATANKDIYRIGAGYNRWRDSAIRQWLNSDKPKGAWWTKQSNLDFRPDQLFNKDGFLRGFDSEFLSAIVPVKQQTATNTISDSGVTDTTYDKFFLPSLEQEYCSPQASGVEGSFWKYWKQTLKGSIHPQGTIVTNHIRYALENHNSAQYVRLRSAYRGYTSNTWYVYSDGCLGGYSALYAFRVCPACVIA